MDVSEFTSCQNKGIIETVVGNINTKVFINTQRWDLIKILRLKYKFKFRAFHIWCCKVHVGTTFAMTL